MLPGCQERDHRRKGEKSQPNPISQHFQSSLSLRSDLLDMPPICSKARIQPRVIPTAKVDPAIDRACNIENSYPFITISSRNAYKVFRIGHPIRIKITAMKG